ncbi:glycoside hydrolase family 127 protein [Ceratobasidium sp. AG-Ba]|nr:glycoside hydrolase family 127 protein [Ceratobasidium sp. AG-Ba]
MAASFDPKPPDSDLKSDHLDTTKRDRTWRHRVPFLRVIVLACLGITALAKILNTWTGFVRPPHLTLAPPVYVPLKLGEIKPSGWLRDQLQIQADGLGGHMHEFYPLIKDGSWTGKGNVNYSNLNEAGSYWFNGVVFHAYTLDYPPLKSAVRDFLDHVIETQWEDGWIGPETDDEWQPRWLWGRYPYLLGAFGMAEAEPELADKIVNSTMRFVQLANAMLKEGRGIQDWTRGTRWQDFALALQWLHEWLVGHGRGSPEVLALLHDTMVRIKAVSIDWRSVFSEELFPKEAVNEWRIYWHGVNLAEGLKGMAVSYRFNKDKSELSDAIAAWNRIYKYHGRPSGIFAADEFLAGLDSVRGTELCLVVNLLPRGSYLYQVTGESSVAERVERQTYNALPATITGDMWAHQYVQQQNQIAARNMTPNPFPSDGPEANVFGLEPDYPCCAVNHMQGFPKFVAAAFVANTERTALVQVYQGPFEVNTMLADGNRVHILVNTSYPFADTVEIRINATKPFNYYLRVPKWALEDGITVKDASFGDVGVAIESQHAKFSVVSGISTFRVLYKPSIRIERLPRSTVALHRGPLLYAYDIPKTVRVTNRHPNEHRAVDLQMLPNGPWQYAIDPSTVRYHQTSGQLSSPVFDRGGSPATLTVTACLVEWGIAGKTFADAPPRKPECIGPLETITLVPYGSTRLRISEFPVMKNNRTVDP